MSERVRFRVDACSLPGGLPHPTAEVVRGHRRACGAREDVWATGTTDVRALQNAAKTSRNAAAYYQASEIRVRLTFTKAFSGNLELYAVDWDSDARRETITVGSQTTNLSSDFHTGAWMTFPIKVALGGTVTITVNRVAGASAVLSGIFLN